MLFVSSSRADLRRCFVLLDSDRSGQLAAHEFKTLLFVCGEHTSKQKIDEWFSLVDEDKSGVLDFAEFCRLMRAMRQSIEVGQRTALGSLGSSISQTVQAAALLDSGLRTQLSPLAFRQASKRGEGWKQTEGVLL